LLLRALFVVVATETV